MGASTSGNELVVLSELKGQRIHCGSTAGHGSEIDLYRGVVELIHGCHAFPDSVATDRGDDPQWLYTVVFDSREIWGADADPTLKISIDAFEPYLEPA